MLNPSVLTNTLKSVPLGLLFANSVTVTDVVKSWNPLNPGEDALVNVAMVVLNVVVLPFRLNALTLK